MYLSKVPIFIFIIFHYLFFSLNIHIDALIIWETFSMNFNESFSPVVVIRCDNDDDNDDDNDGNDDDYDDDDDDTRTVNEVK